MENIKLCNWPEKIDYKIKEDVDIDVLAMQLEFYRSNETEIKLKLNNGQEFMGFVLDIKQKEYREHINDFGDHAEERDYPLILVLQLSTHTEVAIPLRHINQQSILPIELNYTTPLNFERIDIPPKIRFERLNMDKFTCQYCGKRPPEVILEVDHIDPYSNSQNNDINNLITSCRECNRGKSNKFVPAN